MARSPRVDSRETERSGDARRRKSMRVVSNTRRGYSSSENRIGGLQKLVLGAFCRELAVVDEMRRLDYGGIAWRNHSTR